MNSVERKLVEERFDEQRGVIAYYMGELGMGNHPVEKEYYSLANETWLANVSLRDMPMKQKDRLVVLTHAIAQAKDAAVAAFKAGLDKFVRSEKCKSRFSLCLDCDIKNKCARYSKHLAAERERMTKSVDVKMNRPGRLVGKFVVLWRNEEKTAAKVYRVDKKRVYYEVMSGADKGKKFKARYAPVSTVRMYERAEGVLLDMLDF
jgi:hypothetical protein